MQDAVLIGIDLGTTNAKAAAYHSHGKLIAQESVSYPTLHPQHHRAEQRHQDWTQAITEALQRLLLTPELNKQDITGIGLSAHGPGLVLVDEDGEPLHKTTFIWQDERCVPQGRHLVELVGPEWIGLGLPYTGLPARLLWVLENQPELAFHARYALSIKGYLVKWLTGHIADEPTSGPGRDNWWEPVFDACNWSLTRLPPVLSPTTVAGEVCSDVADAIGLPHHLPVVIGMNDGASATLAGGLIQPGDAIVTLSTNGTVRMVISEPLSSLDRLEHGMFCWPYVDNYWIAGGFTKCGAAALEWFVNLLTGKSDQSTFDSFLAEAASCVPGSQGVIFVPHLMGRGSPYPDSESKGAFCNLTVGHERADLTRSVLEGVAFALREILDHIGGSLDRMTDRIHITGGGARSPVWRQIITDVFGCSLTHSAVDSALGAAMVASVGLGLHPDFITAIGAMSHPLGETTPQSNHVDIYQDVFKEFRRLRDAMITQGHPLVDTRTSHSKAG